MPSTVSPSDLVLRLEPVDDDARAEIDQLVAATRILHELDHQVRGAADESGGAQRTACGHDRQDVAVVEDALLDAS